MCDTDKTKESEVVMEEPNSPLRPESDDSPHVAMTDEKDVIKDNIGTEEHEEEKPQPTAVEPPKNEKKKPTRKKKTTLRIAVEFFIKLGVTALIIVLLLVFVVGVYVNHSNSSYPMIKDGDLCITFKLGEYANGDEIAYEQDGEIRFGRIVALPGDTVDILDGSITVNGYGVFENTVYPTTAEGATITFPYKVEEDTVFLLNDYREDITDSRTYGSIPKKMTKGKIVLVIRRRGI